MHVLRACIAATEMLANAAASSRLSKAMTPVLHRQMTGFIHRAVVAPVQKAHVPSHAALLRQVQGRERPFSAAAVSQEQMAGTDTDDGHVYETNYDPDYQNFVALTGTLINPSRTPLGGYVFQLKVKAGTDPEVYDTFPIDCQGDLAEEAAQKLQQDMLVAVQGSMHSATDASGATVLKVMAKDIGMIYSATPESLVAGGPLQPANPQQFDQPAPPAAAPVGIPGMPASSNDPTEQLWMHLFTNPGAWYNNRDTKTGKQPDFKSKADGQALWIDSKRTPAWVYDNLQLLPGGKPYTPPAGGTPRSSTQQAPAGHRPAFLPAEASNEKEEAWMDVFTNYRNWWDNRLNKLNPRAPDFKLKQNPPGTALWLNSKDTPDWVTDNIQQGLPAPPPPRNPQ